MRVALLPLLLALPVTARAERLPFEAYTTDDGLARDGVFRIVSDPEGFLWVATRGGLSQFDGDRFTTFGPRDGLSGFAVHDVAIGRDGTDWVATEAGLFSFLPGEPSPPGGLFRELPLEGVPQDDQPYRLLVDRDGALWVGTFARLWRIETDSAASGGYRSTLVPLAPEGSQSRVQSLAEGPTGDIWVGTHASGIFRIAPDGSVDHVPSEVPGANFVRAFHFDRDGGAWTAFFGGVAFFDRPPFGEAAPPARTFGSETGIGIDSSSLLAAADGTVVVGSTRGVTTMRRSEDGTWQAGSTLDRSAGLPGDLVSSLARDIEGNLWIGLATRGVVRCIENGLTTLPEIEGAGSIMVDLAEDRRGRLAVLTATGAKALTIWQLEGDEVSSHSVSLPADLTYVGWGGGQKMLVDRAGSWWIASGSGVLRYDDPASIGAARLARPPDTVYRTDMGLPGDDAMAVMEDSNGDVWISSDPAPSVSSSVSKWSRSTGRIQSFSAEEVGTRALATQFVENRLGDLWILFGDGGLARLRDGRFEAARDLPPAGRIVQLFLDARDRLWILGRGALLEEAPDAAEPRFTRQEIGAGNSDTGLRCAVEDRSGRIWFGTDRGLLRLDPGTGKVRRFTVKDGLVGNAIGLCSRDDSGTLWFSDTNGLSRVEPRPDPPVALARARLREINVAGEAVPLPPLGATVAGPLTLPPDRRRLSVEFFAAHLGSGPRPRFQFRLEGADPDWSAPTDDRTVQYASLAPGRYRFLVRTVAEDGAVSDAPATVSLRVLAPLWRRGWFQAFAAGAMVAVAAAVYRVRIRRLVALERVRTRIATDLHDDIGSSLSRVAILSEVVRREVEPVNPRSADLLGQIADSARGLTEAMADIVWSLDPRHDDLGHTIFRIREYAADVLSSSGIAWTLIAPDAPERIKLSAERRRHLYLILKEAIHNVLKHAGATSVAITLDVRDGELHAAVRDDGRGLARSDTPRGPMASGHGLENMRARAAQAGGRFQITSEPDGGTRVTLALPLA